MLWSDTRTSENLQLFMPHGKPRMHWLLWGFQYDMYVATDSAELPLTGSILLPLHVMRMSLIDILDSFIVLSCQYDNGQNMKLQTARQSSVTLSRNMLSHESHRQAHVYLISSSLH